MDATRQQLLNWIEADRETLIAFLRAFVRCAVDIRNIDVPAATALGVLVTRASPGFVQSVAELAIGYMVDLSRGISRATADYHTGRAPAPTVHGLKTQLLPTVSGAALYGAGFATRALINLTLSAIKLIGHQQIEISFVRDEAEARAWVAGQRGQHMGEATR